jgi:hypothetical protein
MSEKVFFSQAFSVALKMDLKLEAGVELDRACDKGK